MDISKFDNFRPKTPTEMMLYNEIRRLQRENYILQREKGLSLYQRYSREDVAVSFEPPENLTLTLASRVIGQIDEAGRLSVDARCRGRDKGSLGFAYYVSAQDMMSTTELADVLMHQHEQFVHAMAKEMAKEYEEGT